MIGIQIAANEENKKIKNCINLISGCLAIFLIFLLAIKLNIPSVIELEKKFFTFYNLYEAHNEGTLYIAKLVPYIVLSFIMISTIIISIYICNKEDNPLLFIMLLSGYLTQGVMVMAPYSPLRTTFIPIIFLWVGISYLVYIGEKDNYSTVIAFMIALLLQNVNLGILLLAVYIGIKNIKLQNARISNELLSILLVLLIISIGNSYQVYKGYRINKQIFNDNITRIEDFLQENPTQEEQDNKELYLFLPKDERYGFTPMAGVDWVNEAVKGYFGINQNVQLVPEDPQSIY